MRMGEVTDGVTDADLITMEVEVVVAVATRLYGATRLNGATRLCGATRITGATLLAGPIRLNGVTLLNGPALQDSLTNTVIVCP